MDFLKKTGLLGLMLLFVGFTGVSAGDKEDRFEEAFESLAVVKFSVQHEINRETITTYGLVVNKKGVLLVLPGSIPSWLPVDKIEDVRIFPLDKKSEGFKGVYLGEDFRTSWHYFKVDRDHWSAFKPITDNSVATADVTDDVWGVGVMHISDYFYKPMYLKACVGAVEDVPYPLFICNGPVSAVGGPVFNEKGGFVGIGMNPLSTAYSVQTNEGSSNALLRRVQDSEAFLKSKTLYKYLLKEPISQLKREYPWIGLVGIDALDVEAAKFLGIDKQSALVISNVIEGSPADEAGIKARDIIAGINGTPFKKYASNFDLPYAFHLQFAKYLPGKEIKLSIIRGVEKKEVELKLGKLPKRMKEAPREFYPSTGFSIREFVYEDAINNNYFKMDYNGVVVQFVQPNSPAHTAELMPGDWVKEVDNKTVITYSDAKKLIDMAIKDESRDAIVFLVKRDDETKVVSIKLR